MQRYRAVYQVRVQRAVRGKSRSIHRLPPLAPPRPLRRPAPAAPSASRSGRSRESVTTPRGSRLGLGRVERGGGRCGSKSGGAVWSRGTRGTPAVGSSAPRRMTRLRVRGERCSTRRPPGERRRALLARRSAFPAGPLPSSRSRSRPTRSLVLIRAQARHLVPLDASPSLVEPACPPPQAAVPSTSAAVPSRALRRGMVCGEEGARPADEGRAEAGREDCAREGGRVSECGGGGGGGREETHGCR